MNELIQAGKPIAQAEKVAILLHGRGASAQSILSLQQYLNMEEFALLAPQASGNTWYPYSFMAPDSSNAPALENSLVTVDEAFQFAIKQGVKPENIYFIGFSQGACLSLEYSALHAQKLGGVIAFTGGLIGEKLQPTKYSGDFESTPIFIGSSKRDFHVPLVRIQESAELLEEMGAQIKTLLFEDGDHTIRQDEIDWVNKNMLP